MAILNNSNAISTAGGYDINNSLRIRGIDASAYLNRTPAGAGNRRTWTYSAWIKRGNITPAAGGQSIFYAGSSTTTPRGGIVFGNSGTDNKLSFNGMLYNTTTQVLGLETSAEFRDPSAWYHIVVVLDTTQATSSDRAKIYINGSQVTAFGTATYPSLNQELQYNDAILHATRHPSGDYEYDGYLAEVNFIDGQALTPSSFGETDTTTGSWKPKAYTGTYGTNGFYLKFSDIATTSGSNAGLGKDFSGNANYWTTNNISVTAGTTYDAMIDSPTLTSATVANYAVWNPLSTTGATCADGNLQATITVSGKWTVGTFAVSSGKYYFECVLGGGTPELAIGIAPNSGTTVASNALHYYSLDGKVYSSNSVVATGATFTSGDIIGVAFEPGGNAYFYKNNTLQATVSMPAGSDWAAEVYQTGSRSNTATVNFGQRPFSYTPPTGFVRLNTYNLPDSTIKKGNTVMDATLYTGNSSTQTITNAGAFKPDLVWLKCRSTAGTWNNLIDSVRGTSKTLYSNTTNAEGTDNYLSAFNSNGFGLNTGDSGTNTSGNTYVGWQWQAGQGSTSSNTNGSITSTVSVNATAGFSIVTYTGTGANATVGHGLGVAPKMLIVKNRSVASAWRVWITGFAGTELINLNETGGKETGQPATWNSTVPTSTVFSLGTAAAINGNGNSLVAYLWSEIAGFSKFGSYTGNGSTDGPFVFTGFRPKFILIKNITTAGYSWQILDTARNTYNVMNAQLFPNSSAAEDTTNVLVDYLSNGFKLRNGDGAQNLNSNTYIYMAFAENPFKNANAR